MSAALKRTEDLELAHIHTHVGGDLFIRRTPHGRIRHVLRIGPTDPVTNLFPVCDITAAEARLILEADRTFSLSCIAEALSVHDDEAIPSQLARLAAELNPRDSTSLANGLIAGLQTLAGKPAKDPTE